MRHAAELYGGQDVDGVGGGEAVLGLDEGRKDHVNRKEKQGSWKVITNCFMQRGDTLGFPLK